MADRLLHYFAPLSVFVTFYKSILLPKDDFCQGAGLLTNHLDCLLSSRFPFGVLGKCLSVKFS